MDDTLDPRREQLIALLYGELDAESARALQTEIETDPELRADWEELQTTRTALTGLAEEEHAPSFVFLAPEPSRGAVAKEGFLTKLANWFRTPLAAPAWGAAAAVLLVAVLAVAGFRVHTVPGGFALGFGDELAAPTRSLPANAGMTARGPGGEATSLGISNPNGVSSLDDVDLTQVSGTGSFVTRTDMKGYEAQMFQVVSAMFKDYEKYRDQELAGIVRMMYSEVNQRQDQAYSDLRSRLDAVAVGLLLEQSEDEARYRDLMTVPATLISHTTPETTDDQEND